MIRQGRIVNSPPSPRSYRVARATALGCAAALTCCGLAANAAFGVRTADATDTLSNAIVVTAIRVAESGDDLPLSISRIDRWQIRTGQLRVNLSESLQSDIGVRAEERQNYAQDLQLSVRGFGARSSFGVRGVRLYSDGIPGPMPDGQGQFAHFDLG